MITKKQRDVLDFVVKYAKKNRMMPSYREISDKLGLTGSTHARHFVVALESLGYLKVKKGVGRSIQLNMDKIERCPVCGKK